ncbi:DUF3754 family protein, putative (DUF3754) [Arabidopsis thaliana]|uniref:DUF3754 family protein, putative (DUF3754) n=1 Tax=Arabidopsis thaliana TaxID=3702 RepID=F4IK40_ARATH|nr:DUF3754 family protein, putative (DUF3754) [Arabidopsis thaliana]AEC10771.1 DUF3754 family protein, putative (DUF3754) [Arabidopsis thaliana]|eukprot:NP_850462.2 DUF3754 family protein, putative (DUF3754) [Arabidopsis thaliana]
MLSLRNLTTSFVALPSRSKPSSSPSLRRRLVRCRLTEAATFSPIDVVSGESERAVGSLTELKNGGGWKVEDELPSAEDGGEGGVEDDDSEEEEGISSIHVPREKYINVSKSDLVNGIVTKLLDSQDGGDADIFLLLSSCLDSILHAEHKRILEQMRADFVATQSLEEEELKNSEPRSVNGYEGLSFPLADGFDIWNFLISSGKHAKKRSAESVMAATRFQRSFIQLLDNAGFEELSARDLALTSALNTDYLLTLPVYVDWKKASESNAIVFRRGFATEKEKGLLLVEKLDYIQSKVLQVIFSTIAKPLRKVGKLINKALSEASQTQEIQDLSEGMKVWLKDLSLFKESYLDQTSDNFLKDGFLPDSVLPMQLAAQRAVSRYEGLLTPVGPRAKLFRKLLGWIGFISRDYETPSQLANDSSSSEPYLRPIFLSRMTLADIWKPASKKACGNDIWKRIKTSISILLSPSTLQEPAFEELILLYTKDASEKDDKNKDETRSSLQLEIFERIPIPDLPVIFPHKKLYFRIIDTVRLDIASILGLTAYFVNYKFENISSSPSAFFLDVIAVTALVIYATRVVLGYKQTWDRYQLLVNKTLYEKTLASGFGSVHFLLDASEQQQYKEAILTYAIILQAGKNQNMSYKGVGDRCERFMYDTFKIKVEMRVEKAISTLVRLGLVTETLVDSNTKLQAVPCPQAYISLKELWSSLLG